MNVTQIETIADFFKDLWNYAIDQSFKGKNKKDKREERVKFKSILIQLDDSCKPYGKTYSEFKSCIQSYISDLNDLGPSFDGDWKKQPGKWTYRNDKSIGDIHLDTILCPESDYNSESDEVRYLGWFAYNRAQHECKLDLSTYGQNNEETIPLTDIESIAMLFKDLWFYAVDQSFKGDNKDGKRERREEFKDILLNLKDTCEPYEMTYSQFKSCIQPYVSQLNELGSTFDGDWKQHPAKWTYQENDNIGDIHLDTIVCPESEHANNSDEVTYLGWLAYNRAQHECKLRLMNISEDDQSLNVDDIMSIGNYLKELWEYAHTKNFNSNNRRTKRAKRNEFKDTLETLIRSCEPYGKTYNQFKACTQSYISLLNELLPSWDRDYFEDNDGIDLNRSFNQEEQFTNYVPYEKDMNISSYSRFQKSNI